MSEHSSGGWSGASSEPQARSFPSDHRRQPVAAQVIVDLNRTLEQSITAEVVSRLLLAHRSSEGRVHQNLKLRIGQAPVETFTDHALAGRIDGARTVINALRQQGVSELQILIELLGEAATRLGEMWDDDEVSFADVTLGLCTLHQVLRERFGVPPGEGSAHGCGMRIVFTTLSGEQHIFGAMIVAEVFRQAGWQVATLAGAGPEAIMRQLADKPFDVLAVSATRITDPDGAADEIQRYRDASCEPGLKVIVGGQAFSDQPSLHDQIGADALILDACSAPSLAAGLRQGSKASI